MPRPTLKSAFVVAAATVALAQLISVTFAALPPNRYSNAVVPHTSHLRPLFTQDWRLFAPNPIADDRSVLFQGSYRAPDGSTKRTPWVDWTEVELDLIHHRPIGGRAGYVTNKLYSPLSSRYFDLLPAQRRKADSFDEQDPPLWDEISKRLLADEPAGQVPVAIFLGYERGATRLATQVLQSRWPDRRFTAVRYSLRSQGVTPYSARGGTKAERDEARPLATKRVSGWRSPDVGKDAERRAVAAFDRRHR